MTGYGRAPCIDGTMAGGRSLVHLLYGVQSVYVEGLLCRVPVLRFLPATANVSNGDELGIRFDSLVRWMQVIRSLTDFITVYSTVYPWRWPLVFRCMFVLSYRVCFCRRRCFRLVDSCDREPCARRGIDWPCCRSLFALRERSRLPSRYVWVPCSLILLTLPYRRDLVGAIGAG